MVVNDIDGQNQFGKHVMVAIEHQEPVQCPICHRIIKLEPLTGFLNVGFNNFALIYQCNGCHRFFMKCGTIKTRVMRGGQEVYQELPSSETLAPIIVQKVEFDEDINKVSPSFVAIYNQSSQAEQENLNEIAGMGYRKSLEFLIKDYAKHRQPEESDNIERAQLSKCIDKYIDMQRIKDTAHAAAWIGNDETHYSKKWPTKDISDLKEFIGSCVFGY